MQGVEIYRGSHAHSPGRGFSHTQQEDALRDDWRQENSRRSRWLRPKPETSLNADHDLMGRGRDYTGLRRDYRG